MRMKEVCERTGLTDRAIRLYMENGLVTPRQESNYMGRCSYTFDEQDVCVLETIATLRRAEFSIADIAEMQSSPESLPTIVAAHRQRLAQDIATKQQILGSLVQCDAQAQKDYATLAASISTSASQNSIPKEDSGMRFKDFTTMLRKRIPVLIALVLMLVAVFCVSTLAIRTAFAQVTVAQGGGYALDYQFSGAAALEHWVSLLSVLMLLGSAVTLIVYLAGGHRACLIASAVCCAISVLCLLLMPAVDQEKFYLFEFLAYRGLLKNTFLYNRIPEPVIKAVKFIPIVGSMVLAMVGFFRDRNPVQE